jgi:hypothetical protein
MAIDSEGTPLPHSSAEVDAIVARALEKGELIAAILKDEHGQLCVQVLGPPSRELLEALETATVAYRRILTGHA